MGSGEVMRDYVRSLQVVGNVRSCTGIGIVAGCVTSSEVTEDR